MNLKKKPTCKLCTRDFRYTVLSGQESNLRKEIHSDEIPKTILKRNILVDYFCKSMLLLFVFNQINSWYDTWMHNGNHSRLLVDFQLTIWPIICQIVNWESTSKEAWHHAHCQWLCWTQGVSNAFSIKSGWIGTFRM